MAQYLVPGYGMVNETSVTKQFLILGFGMFHVKIATGGGGGSFAPIYRNKKSGGMSPLMGGI